MHAVIATNHTRSQLPQKFHFDFEQTQCLQTSKSLTLFCTKGEAGNFPLVSEAKIIPPSLLMIYHEAIEEFGNLKNKVRHLVGSAGPLQEGGQETALQFQKGTLQRSAPGPPCTGRGAFKPVLGAVQRGGCGS